MSVEQSDSPAVDFWQVWMRHRSYLYKRCLRWLGGNHHDAEDVLSQGAVKAATYLRANPQRVLQFRPWILRVLRNLCVDEIRAHSRVVPEPTGRGSRAPPPAASWAQCPDQAVLRGEIGRSIEEAADLLPGHLHGVFILRLVDEQPYEEIAAALAITPVNARKRVQQARGLLRDALRTLA